MLEQKKEDLKKFVSEQLSHSQFSNLTRILDITPTKLTRTWKSPKEAALELVFALAREMRIPAYTLVMTYKMGSKKISIDDMESLKELQEGFIYSKDLEDEKAA